MRIQNKEVIMLKITNRQFNVMSIVLAISSTSAVQSGDLITRGPQL